MIHEANEQGLGELVLVAEMIEEAVLRDPGLRDDRLDAGGRKSLPEDHALRDRQKALTGLLTLAEKLSRHHQPYHECSSTDYPRLVRRRRTRHTCTKILKALVLVVQGRLYHR